MAEKKSKYLSDPQTGCWMWQMAKDKNGYGTMTFEGAKTYAHIVFYEQKYGEVTPNMVLDHTCKTPACVNPDHLEAVSQQINVQRGRSAKINAQDVEKIRASYAEGVRQIVLADKYGVGQDQISRIISKKRWSNIV